MRPHNLLFMVAVLLLWVEVKCLTTESKITKRGLCPKPAVLKNSTIPCENRCSNDGNCSGQLKCCDTECGFQCVYGVRPGFCPYNDLPVEKDNKERPRCTNDFDCLKPAKCCDRGSSKGCLPASREKPGKCPDVLKPKSQAPCSSDHDCRDNLKCCSKWCKIPKNGKCPDVCGPKSQTPCSSDHDCQDNLKCCSKCCTIPKYVTLADIMN